ncbi:hypothetical protein [Amycolatopsis sp. NPDC059021]|uniref:hypothetical protein n=1 Tax=Amycolatopsis sp. NPDC059021 TaxID=3346704 RepID=UPI00366D317D
MGGDVVKIHLRIDRVVLDGVGSPSDSRAIHEALQAELARLVATAPSSAWSESRGQRRVSAPEVRPGSPAALGRDIAGSVYRAVGHGH